MVGLSASAGGGAGRGCEAARAARAGMAASKSIPTPWNVRSTRSPQIARNALPTAAAKTGRSFRSSKPRTLRRRSASLPSRRARQDRQWPPQQPDRRPPPLGPRPTSGLLRHVARKRRLLRCLVSASCTCLGLIAVSAHFRGPDTGRFIGRDRLSATIARFCSGSHRRRRSVLVTPLNHCLRRHDGIGS